MPSFWLIERYVNGRLHYWAPGARGRGSRDDWAEDFSCAARFAELASADAVLLHICAGEGRSVEHIFMKK